MAAEAHRSSFYAVTHLRDPVYNPVDMLLKAQWTTC